MVKLLKAFTLAATYVTSTAVKLADVDESLLQTSLKTLPPPDMEPSQLFNFWTSIGDLENDRSTESGDIVTFDIGDAALLDSVQYNTSNVPEVLQGIWWWDNHPTFGHALFSFIGGDKDFKGNFEVDSGEYTYMSMSRPGMVAVPDTPKNRTKLSWFNKYELEMSFPQFNASAAVGDQTFVNTHMSFPFGTYPLPAAIGEGWKFREQMTWDPSHDAAKCFCSLLLTADNEITRHNFGHAAYMGYRVLDHNGAFTSHWTDFKTHMAESGIKSMAMIGEKSSGKDDEGPPEHPDIALLFQSEFSEKWDHTIGGDLVATGLGKIYTTMGGLWAPFYMLAGMDMTVTFVAPQENGASSSHVRWVGWNNFVTSKVDRYLMVEYFDADGASMGPVQCTAYPDKDPKGYKDPILLMAERYQLVSADGETNKYQYDWDLGTGQHQTAVMTTSPAGGPPKTVDMTVVSPDGSPDSVYAFTYFDQVHHVDNSHSSLFYDYKKYDCTLAPGGNFTAPTICFDSWLGLQYECP